MLEHGIDAPYPVAGALGVVRGDDVFKQIPPIQGTLFVMRINLGQSAIATGLFQPEFEL